MKKFHFPLETLLKVRNQRVKMYQRELLEKEKECSDLNQAERAIREKILLHEREIKVHEVQSKRYLDFLKSEAGELLTLLNTKQKERLECQKVATKVLQERKVVEKIKKKSYAAWHVESEREEQKERNRG